MADRPLQQERDSVRIPLYQEDSVGASSPYLSAFGQGQHFINCVPQFEMNPVTKEGTAIVQKRPGVKATSLTGDFGALFTDSTMVHPKDNIVITQCHDVNVCAVSDTTAGFIRIIQYLPATGTVTLIGSIAGADPRDWCQLSELDIAGVPTLGVVWTQYDKQLSKCYYATSVAGSFPAASLTQITDGDFPDQLGTPMVCTGRFVQLDFTTYIATTNGYLHNSDQYSISSWNSSGNLQTYAYPDRTIGAIRYKNHIVVFSEDSVEFFNDAGKKPPGSPLERTQQAFIKFGCVDSQCMINVDDNLYWISSSQSATDGLWKLEGYTPVKVSNPNQDLQISSAYATPDLSSIIHLRSLSMMGMTHILLTNIISYCNALYQTSTVAADDDDNPADGFAARGTQLVYCIDYGTWWGIKDHGMGTGTALAWLPCAYNPIAGGSVQNKYLQFIQKVGNFGVDAAIYTLESTDTWSYYQDQTFSSTEEDTTMVQASFQLHPLEFATSKRKFIHKLTISMEPVSTTKSASWVYMTMNKEEGIGDVPSVTRNCAMVSTTKRYYFNRLGSTRKAQFGFMNKSANGWIIRALDVDLSQGTA